MHLLTALPGQRHASGGHGLRIVRTIDEALGLRELRAKVNGKAGIKAKYPPNRFSIQAELCYHPKSIEVVRKYLDSGVLSDYIAQHLENGNRCWTGEDYRRYTVLIACAMTLGCNIPDRVRETMEKMQRPVYLKNLKQKYPQWALKPLANIQLKEALEDYVDGEPYDFGNTTMLEASINRMFPGTTTVRDIGHSKMVEIKQKSGNIIPHIVGPPDDEEIGLKPIYPNHLCATCGSSEMKEGEGALLVCSRCHDRKYCSKECQKRHWKMHKVICTKPADQMANFMQSIEPLNFGDDDSDDDGGNDSDDDSDDAADSAAGDSPVMFMS